MKKQAVPLIALSFCLGWITSCDKIKEWNRGPSAETPRKDPVEIYSAGERAASAKLMVVEDPIEKEIDAFRRQTRPLLNTRKFDALESMAADIRAKKERFENGSWKILQFYGCFACQEKEPDGMWKLHEQIHKDWIAAKPNSITARVAYADFLKDYAWHARGSGYADTVTQEGWRIFAERLALAHKIFDEARQLPEKDPVLWFTALTVALGEGWPKPQFDALVSEAVAQEPKFWGFHTSRAYSLLPRWHGEPGDWEAYAEEASSLPDGAGAEVYVRIVLRLVRFYDNIFRDTKASWPKTREGLEQMLKEYPKSLEILSQAAKLATMASDRPYAKQLFDRLGDNYLPQVWSKPERLTHYRHWAETGTW